VYVHLSSWGSEASHTDISWGIRSSERYAKEVESTVAQLDVRLYFGTAFVLFAQKPTVIDLGPHTIEHDGTPLRDCVRKRFTRPGVLSSGHHCVSLQRILCPEAACQKWKSWATVRSQAYSANHMAERRGNLASNSNSQEFVLSIVSAAAR
jgi:hypothetical protein